jgi:hypothetical protein
MKYTPSLAKQPGLTDQETATLRGIAISGVIERPHYKRLQRLGLIEQKDSTWVLTPQGHIHLMFQAAR